jgi:excisionase family DNA binding protein
LVEKCSGYGWRIAVASQLRSDRDHLLVTKAGIGCQHMLRGTPALVGPQEERINLPESVYHLLKQVVANMMRGKVIVLTPENNRLTTQAAANYLGFSRPHLVKLLDSGAIPFERVGQHRRVYMKDLEHFP